MSNNQPCNPVLGKLAFLNRLAKASSVYKEAPFKSEAQRRRFHAMADRGEISKKTLKKWVDETPKGKKLPERKHRKVAIVGKGLLFAGKSMLWPKGLAQNVAGIAGWGGLAGGAMALRKPPTGKAAFAAFTDKMIELQKESIEFREHNPLSTDIAEPDVKKNSTKTGSVKLGNLIFPGVEVKGTSGRTSAPISPSRHWLTRQRTSDARDVVQRSRVTPEISGHSTKERAVAAGPSAPINRPNI